MSDGFSSFSKRSNLDSEDYYLSEEGYIDFTEKHQLKRGYCCKSGCKHCPYGYDKKTNTIKKKTILKKPAISVAGVAVCRSMLTCILAQTQIDENTRRRRRA